MNYIRSGGDLTENLAEGRSIKEWMLLNINRVHSHKHVINYDRHLVIVSILQK